MPSSGGAGGMSLWHCVCTSINEDDFLVHVYMLCPCIKLTCILSGEQRRFEHASVRCLDAGFKVTLEEDGPDR
jgi:hypothetical protein